MSAEMVFTEMVFYFYSISVHNIGVIIYKYKYGLQEQK